jgi:hypothetical protein
LRRQRFRNKNFNLKTEYNMKTRTSIYHNPFAFAYVLLVAVIFCGCGEQTTKEIKPIEMGNVYENEIIVFDSCEYIKWRTYNGYYNITHKGDCKFCAERSKK